MRCALGLVLHKLGMNFYDAEETKDGLAFLRKSFDYMESLPDQLKIRHLNTIQDLYNHIAIISSERGGISEKEDVEINDKAVKYLEKAKEIYHIVKNNTFDMPHKKIITNFDLYLLKQSKNKDSDSSFSFFINSGLDLDVLEKKYTTTLFVMA